MAFLRLILLRWGSELKCAAAQRVAVQHAKPAIKQQQKLLRSDRHLRCQNPRPPVGQRCWVWPANGKVILPYSTAEGGNKGIDISGARGTPVYAAGAGKVVYVGNQLRGYGNLIMIKHNEDYITAYAHNDTMLVNNGQSVKAGQKSLRWAARMPHP